MTIVAIVGIDGCGKTTQAKMLVDNLRREGFDAVYVEPVFLLLRLLRKSDHERFRSSVSPRNVRTASVKNRDNNHHAPRKLLMGALGYIYALLSYVILSRRSKRSRIVVCDRYFFQFFYDLYGKRADSIMDIFPKPDITFYLHGRVDTLHERMSDPSDASTPRDYFSEVRRMYESLCRRYYFIRVDAELRADLIGQEMLEKVVNASKYV